MRTATTRLTALVAVAALLATTTAGALASVKRAHLTLVRASPVTLRGSNFPARTRVTVKLNLAGTRSHTVTTSRTGTFNVVFGSSAASCSQWTATATRRHAPAVVLHGPKPMCMPAGGYGGY